MGRSRNKFIKTLCNSILKEYPDKVTDNFELNKVLVEEITDVSSKKLRNKIAGYLVVEKKKSRRLITHPRSKPDVKSRPRKRVGYTNWNE
jgi:small subunit ribosomal protein S17e